MFGEYFLKALINREPSSLILKFTSFVCVTWAFLLHGTALKWGLRAQNVLGIFQLIVVGTIAGTGLFALRNGIEGGTGLPKDRWRGRDNFRDVWQGTILSAPSICLSLYSVRRHSLLPCGFLIGFVQVIYSFIGFSNANYALSEMHNPARTIRIAGPLAIIAVAILYLFSNIAYFAGASKDEIIHSGRLVVSLLMRNVWGTKIERWVNFGVAGSSLGNVLAIVSATLCYQF